MPVDLKQIGPPRQYPPPGPRLRTWLFVWAGCVTLIAGAVLLLWPSNLPAHGAWFWLWVAGLPNAVFITLVAWNRMHYESVHLQVLFYNDHRENRRRQLIALGQQGLHLLGYAYRLPLKGGTLAQTVIDGPELLQAQSLRDGHTIVRHTRLPDDTDIDPSDLGLLQALYRAPLTREGKLYARLLAPLAGTLNRLAAAGAAPAVHLVLPGDALADEVLEQLRAVIGAFDLPALDCRVTADSEGLMPIDAWLDAKNARPLLVLAIQLNDVPPEDSAEGGVAILLAAEAACLPAGLKPCATIHRPVVCQSEELAEAIALATLWGNADPAAIGQAWLTGFDSHQYTQISEACRLSGLTGVTSHKSRYVPDRAIGHAGAAAGWLAIVAATECGAESPQLIMNRAQTIQAAILRTHSKST